MSVPSREFFYTWDSNGYGYDSAWIMGKLMTPDPIPTTVKEPEKKAEEKNEVIELKVPFCCEKCVEKMYKKLTFLEGVSNVECNKDGQKVTVSGNAKPDKVLKEAQSVQRRSELVKKKK